MDPFVGVSCGLSLWVSFSDSEIAPDRVFTVRSESLLEAFVAIDRFHVRRGAPIPLPEGIEEA